MKARIVKTQIGVMSYYHLEIECQFLYFFKSWNALSWVDLASGKPAWYVQRGSLDKVMKTLKDFETLHGIKLELELEPNNYKIEKNGIEDY